MWWAFPAGSEGLKRVFEFSPGPTVLAAGQVKLGVSTMAFKPAAHPGLQALERRRKLDGLKS